jgi:PAS domain S-box-containing protein
MFIVSLSSMAFIIYILLGIYTLILNKKSTLNKLFAFYCSCFALWSLSSVFINAIVGHSSILYRVMDKAGGIGWCTYYGVTLHMTLMLTKKSKILEKRSNIVLIYTPGIIMLLVNIIFLQPELSFFIKITSYFTYVDFFWSFSYVSASLIMIWKWGGKSKIRQEKTTSKIIVYTGLASYCISLFLQDGLFAFHMSPLYISNVVSLIFAFGIFYGIINYELLKISASSAAEYIVSKVRDLVILLDSNDKIIYGNPQVLVNLGYFDEELNGKHYSVIFKDAFELKVEKYETYCISKDKTEIPVYVRATEIQDKTGDHIGTVLVIKNISETIELSREIEERKHAEDILLKNQTSYDLLIKYARDAILVHDEFQTIFANESSANLLGFINPEQKKENNAPKMIPVDIRSHIQQKISQTKENEENIRSFYGKVLRNDGKIVDMEIISAYLMYKGKATILSILRDITPEKQVEKLKNDAAENIKLLNETKEYNKLITEFFSNVSHELKTPLNVIYSALQTLILYKDIPHYRDKCEKYLFMMRQNCYRLTKLINNLLDLTKLDSGFLKLELKNLNIVSLIEDITLSIVTYAEACGVGIIFDTNDEEKLMACDPDKIERILLNLISNSIKFTNLGGSIHVTVTVENSNVLISIKDNGVGIPEENLQIIFERFGQVDKTLRRNHEGCGIGLSLVKSLVELHGGSIKVESKLGEGSEFIIQLPVTLLEDTMTEEHVYEINMEKVKIELSDLEAKS